MSRKKTPKSKGASTPAASTLPTANGARPARSGTALSGPDAPPNGPLQPGRPSLGGGVDFYDVAFKVMLVGDSGVGKTCLLVRFKDGAFLAGTFISTVGIDFRVINTLADLRHRGTDFGGSPWLLIITVFLRSYKFVISLCTSYLSVSFLKTIFPSQNGHDGSTDVQQRARRSNGRRQEGIKIVLEAIFTLWRQVETKVRAKIHKMKVTTKVNRHDKINGKRKTAKEHLRKLSIKEREHAEKERQLSEAEENGKLDMKEIHTYKKMFQRAQALRRRAEDYYKCKIPPSARKPLCNWLCAQALQREMAERKAAYKHHSPIPVGNRVVQKPNALWQMDVTHVPSFGRLSYVHVTVDTYSHFIWATCQTGESTSHVKKHLLSYFAVMGVPEKIKTDNGPGYCSKAFQKFLSQWKISHTTGIPYNSQGQAIVERTNRTLKTQLVKQKEGGDSKECTTPQMQLYLALYTLNFLNIYRNQTTTSAEQHLTGKKNSPHEGKLIWWKDNKSKTWEIGKVITWGRGFACVSPGENQLPVWIPTRHLKFYNEPTGDAKKSTSAETPQSSTVDSQDEQNGDVRRTMKLPSTKKAEPPTWAQLKKLTQLATKYLENTKVTQTPESMLLAALMIVSMVSAGVPNSSEETATIENGP
ncbi:uncharacterized protein LOC112205920 isoform X12 [Pan troglodytes]|uniref:uncharacterized protein LOC112205920 isoform X12 n=1 Tax=Pan troglodytes TaxID=9598 RepID=UPI0023F3B7A1|nr:uncharacterized protein LOC112205920 isoform X11 [Pan troglodytes]